MAIPFLNHLDLRSTSQLKNAILDRTTEGSASNVRGKIIYDTMIQGGYSIFDFLSGDFSGFTISNSTANRESIQLDYNMHAFNITGKIWIKQKLFEPIKFTFGNNPERPDQFIEVEITNYSPIVKESLFQSFNPNAEEIIDLRE